MLTIFQVLQWGITQLKHAKVESPELDAEVLLAHVFVALSPLSPPIREGESSFVPSPSVGEGRVRGRAWLYAHPEHRMNGSEIRRFKTWIHRRARREPVAYILGHKEFYGLDFLVNKSVLVPRPESELLVEQAIRECKMKNEKCKIIDVGTGSGAIIISTAKTCNLKPATYFATDISPAALKVAKQNARRHGVEKRIKFLCGNLLEPIKDVILNETQRSEGSRLSRKSRDSSPPAQNDGLVIVANLPYLPTSEWRATQPEIRKWEPRNALDGGKDGLKYYREMFRQFYKWIHNPPQPSLNLREGDRSVPPLRVRGGEGELRATILCEICPEQAIPFRKMVRRYFPRAHFSVKKDLSGRNRVVVVHV